MRRANHCLKRDGLHTALRGMQRDNLPTRYPDEPQLASQSNVFRENDLRWRADRCRAVGHIA